MLKYIELKTGYADNGPVWIANVRTSKTGRTLYFNGRALKSAKGKGVAGNYFDFKSGKEFWISNVKKNGQNRHWAGSGKIFIEEKSVPEYLAIVGSTKLDPGKYEIFQPITVTDPAEFHDLENSKR